MQNLWLTTPINIPNGIFLSFKWPVLHFINSKKHQRKWILSFCYCNKRQLVDKFETAILPVVLITSISLRRQCTKYLIGFRTYSFTCLKFKTAKKYHVQPFQNNLQHGKKCKVHYHGYVFRRSAHSFINLFIDNSTRRLLKCFSTENCSLQCTTSPE